MGISFIIITIALVLVGCFVVVLRRSNKKKAVTRALLIICAVAVVWCLVISGTHFAPYLSSTADFSGIVIHDYTLGQVVTFDEAGLNQIEPGDKRVTYTLQSTNVVYLRVDGTTNQIIEIDAYQNEDSTVRSQMGSLLVGISTREDVEREYGTRFLQHLFIDGYQSRISYYDRTNRIELVFSFTGEVLEQIKLIAK